MPTLAFDALEPIEKRIRQVRNDIGYISISEVIDRKHYEPLGRIDFNESDLAPYLLDQAIDDDDEDNDDIEEGDALPDLVAPSPVDEALRQADAGCRWIREMVASNMNGQEEGRFRLFVWRPKGEQILFTARFSCVDVGYVAPGPASEPGVLETAKELLPNVQMTPEREAQLEALPAGRTWAALGAGHEQLLALTQKTYGHLATLQNTTINNQNTQILRMGKVIEDMASDRAKVAAGLNHADETRRTEEGESRVREELGKQFISEIGTFGRVIASAKFGMAPELVELAELVNGSPELMDAMKKPEVRQLLRDEKNRKELAAMLLMAASAPANASPGQPTAA